MTCPLLALNSSQLENFKDLHNAETYGKFSGLQDHTGLGGSLGSIFKQVWLQIGACHTHKISNNSLSSSFVLILKI